MVVCTRKIYKTFYRIMNKGGTLSMDKNLKVPVPIINEKEAKALDVLTKGIISLLSRVK